MDCRVDCLPLVFPYSPCARLCLCAGTLPRDPHRLPLLPRAKPLRRCEGGRAPELAGGERAVKAEELLYGRGFESRLKRCGAVVGLPASLPPFCAPCPCSCPPTFSSLLRAGTLLLANVAPLLILSLIHI